MNENMNEELYAVVVDIYNFFQLLYILSQETHPYNERVSLQNTSILLSTMSHDNNNDLSLKLDLSTEVTLADLFRFHRSIFREQYH